jgi:TonB family protein
MRVQFLQSFDFNQMLVFSVFVHLLLLTMVLFLPKPAILEKVVVPSFMVNLVSEPAGFKKPGPKRSESVSKKPKAKKKSVEKKSAPKKAAKKIPALKKTPVSKPTKAKPVEVKKVPTIKTPKPNKALEALNKLEGSVALAAPNVVEELDQVARLEKTRKKPAKPAKQKSISEETIRDLESLKNKKVIEKKTLAPVPPPQDILEDFDVPKMEKNLSETTAVKQQEPAAKDLEPEKSKAPEVDLLKELELLAKLDASPLLVPDVETKEPRLIEETQKSSESYDSIIEKFDSLSVDSDPIKVEVSSARLDSSSFQSKLRTLPKATRDTTETGTGDSYVFTKKEGPTGANVQSLYVGMIQERIFKNWREPLAEQHNQEAVVSFFIFPQGNIDKPFIKKSSGVEALDTLAVRAVLDSVPFPEFPKELKMSNLHINIYFKYVPKDE